MPNPKAEIIFNHPLTKITKYDKISKCFKLKKGNKYSKLKGITKIIKETFYPNYEYIRDKYSSSTGVSNSWEGKNRGSLIHRQLRDFFNEPFEKFKIKHEEVHDYTKKAIIALKKWDLVPLRAELPICDPKEGISTGVDAICTRDSKLLFIDWKTGYDEYIEKGSGMMEGILNFLSNCPRNQAYIQLVVESEIIRRNYGTTPDELHVVQLCNSGVNAFKVPDIITKLSPRIYDCVIGKMKKLKELKKLNKKTKK